METAGLRLYEVKVDMDETGGAVEIEELGDTKALGASGLCWYCERLGGGISVRCRLLYLP